MSDEPVFYLSISGTIGKVDDSEFTEAEMDALVDDLVAVIEKHKMETVFYARPGKE